MPEKLDALVELGALLKQRGYRFVTVTPATQNRTLAREAGGFARDLRDVFGKGLPFAQDAIEPEIFQAMRRAGVVERADTRWRSTVRWSSLGEDLFVHSRHPTDQADAVFFGPDTYRFVRAIETALAGEPAAAIARAIEIGCGTGAAAIRLAQRYPAADVVATDINRNALDLARVNARLAGTANLDVRHSDLFDSLDGDFDLIVANPPYMADPAGRAYRDGGGELGAGLSLAIVEQGLRRLRPHGRLLLYTGSAIVSGEDRLRQRLETLLDARTLRWHYQEIDPDVFGEELESPAYRDVERIAAVFMDMRISKRTSTPRKA